MEWRKLVSLLLLILAQTAAPGLAATNSLATHPSPYLALHGEDPVDWTTWQAEVFERARADNRLVFVSIGYFSCHWCHVMQQESYRDPEVAKILNAGYIAVKVDRELDPDLDQRLIDFVEKVRGSAGWPLNVFLSPEGYPITGFTYLPRDQFVGVLTELGQEWRQNHAKIGAAARNFFETEMQDFENQAFHAPDIPAKNLIDAFVSQSMLAADEMLGGFGNTSKFPNVPQLDALLEIIARNPELDADVAGFAQLTLDAMAANNLHDHVNGGFFRYTTDPDWQTPHYEKMLYDNAQLARLYFKADRMWPDRGYAGLALRTLDFVESSLRHAQGGYMSSLSAVDVDNREGGAYLWTREQLEQVLSAEEVAHLEQRGQFARAGGEFLIRPLDGSGDDGDPELEAGILEKLQQRGSNDMPADSKRLASWNAMMLDALTDAADFEQRFAPRAAALYRFMIENFYRDGELVRLAGNAAAAAAVLEDYAQVAHALLRYGSRFDQPAALEIAQRLVQSAHAKFLVNDRWQQKTYSLIPLAPGKWVIPDMVSPSPMTLWLRTAVNLPRLDPGVRASANKMLERVTREMLDAPYFYGSFILLRADRAGQA